MGTQKRSNCNEKSNRNTKAKTSNKMKSRTLVQFVLMAWLAVYCRAMRYETAKEQEQMIRNLTNGVVNDMNKALTQEPPHTLEERAHVYEIKKRNIINPIRPRCLSSYRGTDKAVDPRREFGNTNYSHRRKSTSDTGCS